jgi:hypothetical protein
MFFIISWRWVVNVLADMRMMRTTVTIWTVRLSAPMNRSDSCAPKKVDASASPASWRVIGPIGSVVPSEIFLRPLSTRNRPKKNGDCSRIGRHELNGLVPVRL